MMQRVNVVLHLFTSSGGHHEKLVTITLGLMLTCSVLLPKKAEAGLIIAATGGAAGVPLIIAGVVVGMPVALITGMILTNDGVDKDALRENRRRNKNIVLSVFFTGLGILILDEASNESIKYTKITDEEALKLGISVSAQKSFNKNVNAVNQIAKAIAKKCTVQFAGLEVSELDYSEAEACANKGWSGFRKSNPKILNDEVYGAIESLRIK